MLHVATISAHWSLVVQLPPQNLDQASFTTFLVSSQKASAPLCSSSWSKCLDPAKSLPEVIHLSMDFPYFDKIQIDMYLDSWYPFLTETLYRLISTFTCMSIDDHSSHSNQQETRQQFYIQHFVKVSEIISPTLIITGITLSLSTVTWLHIYTINFSTFTDSPWIFLRFISHQNHHKLF